VPHTTYNSGDATNGYMSPSALATCVQQAKSQGWSAVRVHSLSVQSAADVLSLESGCNVLGGALTTFWLVVHTCS
jgi:hypothetical protein